MVGLIKICVNMDKEKSKEKQGKMKRKQRKTKGRGREKKKKREREKSTDIGSVCGPHKQLKNIEWWQVSNDTKRVRYFKVMSDE